MQYAQWSENIFALYYLYLETLFTPLLNAPWTYQIYESECAYSQVDRTKRWELWKKKKTIKDLLEKVQYTEPYEIITTHRLGTYDDKTMSGWKPTISLIHPPTLRWQIPQPCDIMVRKADTGRSRRHQSHASVPNGSEWKGAGNYRRLLEMHGKKERMFQQRLWLTRYIYKRGETGGCHPDSYC